MTERLYYDQQNLLTFEARVVELAAEATRVYLDRTAFYPTSGGQPFDRGRLNGIEVVEVTEEDGGRIAHRLGSPWPGGEEVQGEIESPRRRDHQEQHTGQHLLSAVIAEHLGITTLSFHLGAESSTIDLETAALSEAEMVEIERRANGEIRRNRPVRVSYEDAATAEGLRKASDRTGVLRVVTIEGLDRSACGGTHVAATGEIGFLSIRKVEKVRGVVRLEFLCGARAVERARRDYEALSGIARGFTIAMDQAPAQVRVLQQRLEASEKTLKKMALEDAMRRGRDLYLSTPPNEAGKRVAVREVPALSEELRVESQGFTSGSQAALVGLAAEPPAILLAVSADYGIAAQQVLKPLLEGRGGRGGGSATLAQGTLPSREAVAEVAQVLQGYLAQS